ncbi:hypothetical protein NHX12_014461 [Muraenolepis orangiensis]|uniref:Somatostatin/Cortistatin C-terminal domain-containing protein n=1 Tax=Muraenolepis orangiensis TaxID=630683 RepID=A0A9Q0DCI0_9TELE|nr:hypothetical protein NHX12_014461 [Muraenolepis orangiensis]
MVRSQLCSYVCVVLLMLMLGCRPLVGADGASQVERLTADLETDEDLARLLLLDYLAEMARARTNEVLPEVEASRFGGVVRRHLALSQRERKAGCRNFFWKTFTSC